MSSFVRRAVIAVSAVALVAGSAPAQLLPTLGLPQVSVPVPNVPVAGPVAQEVLGTREARQAISPTLDAVRGLPDGIAESGEATLLQLRRLRLQQLIRDYPRQLESDGGGQPVTRGRLIAIDPDPGSLQLAASAGFFPLTEERHSELGVRVVHLRVPRGLGTREALRRLRTVAPRLEADFDHVFEPAGGNLLPVAAALAAQGSASGPTIGMIDGGVASHPSLASASIEQNGFSGAPQPTGHGTAVASLLVGSHGPFRGAARGSSLLVADVYGGSRAAGSATTVVRALAWLASRRPGVIN
ncbi:S8 family serine peptidase, partial [Sphingomonas sp.]|uniref:S8 family serine peptidase n=1 Tax=Sphingomonas sp. TaxID=28214 RepID=UPI0017D65C6F|nr:serine protease [Sphingomonas sp.]